jgi:hypothetical protein
MACGRAGVGMADPVQDAIDDEVLTGLQMVVRTDVVKARSSLRRKLGSPMA